MVLHDDVGMQTMLLVLCLIVRSDKKAMKSCLAFRVQHSSSIVNKCSKSVRKRLIVLSQNKKIYQIRAWQTKITILYCAFV